MQRGSDTYEIPVILYIQKVDAQSAQDSLDAFLASSGSDSIKSNRGRYNFGRRLMSVRVVSGN